MSEFTTKSGAEIIIYPAPWKAAKELKKVIENHAAEMKVSVDLDDINSFIYLILKVDGSDAFESALWPCLNRCLRNGEKIVESTFDGLEARKDYVEIVIACVKENLGPLVENLFLQLSTFTKKKPEDAPIQE